MQREVPNFSISFLFHDSRYLCNHQQLANLGGTVAIFDVLQKPLCRHWLDAAIVPRPFILPIFSLTFSPFRSFVFRSGARSPSVTAHAFASSLAHLRSTHLVPGSRFGRHLDRVSSAISEASRG
jgi:hypothetical protein